MSAFRDRLYISTIADDARELALADGLGLEIADFCTAYNMDLLFEETDKAVREKMDGVSRFIFHCAYNELCPAAIDPLVREHTARRYAQALDLAARYGIRKAVIHTGFIPLVYFPEWFIPESVKFWREFLASAPADVTICLENVMEPGPAIQTEIARQVDDPRLRLCLDVGHAATGISRTPVPDWIDAMAPYLAHVHIHNNDGDADLHSPLGDGVLDMNAVLHRIEELCPSATYTIENISSRDSIRWLRENRYI